MSDLPIRLDRLARKPLAAQVYAAIRNAIETGHLGPGARLPSWQDLAAQLGVSRGTVRAAYGRLINEQRVIGLGAAGTRVAVRLSPFFGPGLSPEARPFPELFNDFGTVPLTFQMGVPAQDAFPFKLWSRVLTRAARRAAAAPISYPDPRGDPDLRKEIAAYLGIARGLQCMPAQVLVTGGFSGALGLAVQGLGFEGKTAWVEDPGFPLTRAALGLAGMTVAPIPVDKEGLDVAFGLRSAPRAALAVVTPGQQAPLGVTMSHSRRLALLASAREHGTWIIEDDYLGDLQLEGRAAPALASLDRGGRTLHIGSFSKTISPALRLGYLVVPPDLARRFGELATCLAPAPSATVQHAVAEFMREGHYLRHLRHMKQLYSARRDLLIRCLREADFDALRVETAAGLAVIALLPKAVSDLNIARRGLPFGLGLTPLSPWYMRSPPRQGLLLSATNLDEQRLKADCRRIVELVR